jgi:hypothetical protein
LVPAHPAHWAAALVPLILFGASFRPRLCGLLAFALLLPLAFLDRGQASRHLVLFALLATSLWNGDSAIWPRRLVQIPVPVTAVAFASPLMEYFLAVAFWFRRLRWVAAGAGVAFHLVATAVVWVLLLDLLATMFLYLAFLLRFEARAGAPAPGNAATPFTRPARSASRRE